MNVEGCLSAKDHKSVVQALGTLGAKSIYHTSAIQMSIKFDASNALDKVTKWAATSV